MNRVLVPLMSMAVLTGCFGGQTCDQPKAYQKAKLTAPVQPPEGLDSLDENRDLQIPVASTPPGAGDGRCLEQPPAYSEGMAAIREGD